MYEYIYIYIYINIHIYIYIRRRLANEEARALLVEAVGPWVHDMT